eukprot:5000354-Prymnesium_polylepis.1
MPNHPITQSPDHPITLSPYHPIIESTLLLQRGRTARHPQASRRKGFRSSASLAARRVWPTAAAVWPTAAAV